MLSLVLYTVAQAPFSVAYHQDCVYQLLQIPLCYVGVL